MNITVSKSPPQPSLSLRSPPTNFFNPSPFWIPRVREKQIRANSLPLSVTSFKIRDLKSETTNPNYSIQKTSNVSHKLQSLASEFRSLSEPVDRVKRLLRYASLLPELDESSRVDSNKVPGCTAQVWLEVKMDREGVMRFRADSDSEITKGFCFCLIWLLDGAGADEVLEVDADDLGEMNVGISPIRSSSRVNTWQNVFISMQRRTEALTLERFV